VLRLSRSFALPLWPTRRAPAPSRSRLVVDRVVRGAALPGGPRGIQGAFTPRPRPLSPSRGEGCQVVISGWKARATWNAAHPCPNAHLIRVHSCSFVVQNTISFVFIRVHSWFETTPSFVFIRGLKPLPHSCPFVVRNHPLIRVHSCPFVVPNHPSIRVHSWFKTTPSCVSIRGSKHHSIPAHSWFKTENSKLKSPRLLDHITHHDQTPALVPTTRSSAFCRG
jgi:hypothetical protein